MADKKDAITMLHGAGGTVMHDLVKNYVVKYFGGVSAGYVRVMVEGRECVRCVWGEEGSGNR